MGECRLNLYYDYEGLKDTPYVDEIILTPEEMAELASWHVPSPFCDDLTPFADILPDVELVGETIVAGRRAYSLRGQLFGLGATRPDEIPHPVTSTVTLTVDAETYWLLGREEMMEGKVQVDLPWEAWPADDAHRVGDAKWARIGSPAD